MLRKTYNFIRGLAYVPERVIKINNEMEPIDKLMTAFHEYYVHLVKKVKSTDAYQHAAEHAKAMREIGKMYGGKLYNAVVRRTRELAANGDSLSGTTMRSMNPQYAYA